jgi:hypothetical protein
MYRFEIQDINFFLLPSPSWVGYLMLCGECPVFIAARKGCRISCPVFLYERPEKPDKADAEY